MSLKDYAFVHPPIPPFNGERKSHFEDVRLSCTAEEAALNEVKRHLARGKTKQEAYRLAGLAIPDDDDDYSSGNSTPASSYKP